MVQMTENADELRAIYRGIFDDASHHGEALAMEYVGDYRALLKLVTPLRMTIVSLPAAEKKERGRNFPAPMSKK